MSSQTYEPFIAQLKRDCSFLENNNIIDYSFLIGVHKTDKKDTPVLRLNDFSALKNSDIHFNRIIYSEKFARVYIIGIIDILTEYKLVFMLIVLLIFVIVLRKKLNIFSNLLLQVRQFLPFLPKHMQIDSKISSQNC